MNLDKVTLVEYYRIAKRIRLVELKIANEYAKGEMRCPVHLSVGQEIVSAAFAMAQKKGDTAVSSHRAHAHYLAKGGNLYRMIAEIFGKSTGCCKGRGGSMHLIDLSVGFLGSSAIVGNSIPIGVGSGFSHKLNESGNLAFTFFGDGATEEGVFYESINFAAVNKIPTVFLCENNSYSVYTNLAFRQPENRKIYEMVKSIGINSYFIRTQDPIQCLKSTFEALDYARKFNAPIFIEFMTYRWLEHCGPNDDDDLGYRPSGELNSWKSNDPVLELEKVLILQYEITHQEIESIINEIEKEISGVFDLVKSDPYPTLDDSLKDVYA
jgi:TPP-dependent pyruvate/acetoin dehydrogenase alpha subunit